ncbi:hypothetical protein DPMN_000100 [Dreissena polymorpha]|uniref:Uncharacterized protein n=1 Tax=Dreissena polymorpha TaxID=45954 RepID=A0A9D4MER9_DREPO|nr:hypothetical protein DPMN_000100 [Dreissena polymorpha]
MEKCPGHVFQQTRIIFKIIQDFIRTNILTKFHEDWTINVSFRVKNAPSPGGHVFQPTKTIFKLVKDIIRTNILIKFHDDRTVYVASRVLTRFYKSQIMKNATYPGGHVFQPTETIFQLIQDIIETNLLTTVLTRKTAQLPCAHIFQPTETIFELVQDIINTNPENKMYYYSHTMKNAPPPGDIIGTNLLTKFHENRTIHVASRVLTSLKNAPPSGSHVCQATGTIFEFVQDMIATKLLTNS